MNKSTITTILGVAILSLIKSRLGSSSKSNTPRVGLHVFWKGKPNQTIYKQGIKPEKGKVYFWNINDQGEKSAEAFARYLSDRFSEQYGDGRIGLVEIDLTGFEDSIIRDPECADMDCWFPHLFEPGEFGEGYIIQTNENIGLDKLIFVERWYT